MPKQNYQAGMKWNSLTLVSDLLGGVAFKSSHKSVFLCDCGKNHFATLNNVTRGVVSHCSSCSAKIKSERRSSHRHSMSCKDENPIGYKCYYTWQAMKRRCNNPRDKRYDDYGGRGIKVCERWSSSYEAFLEDMGLPPSDKHQIDRINNDGDYEPSNCRWVDRVQNARNKRNTRLIFAFGESLTLAEWSERSGILQKTIEMRIKRGMTPEEAITSAKRLPGKVRRISTPHGEFESLSECSRALGIAVSTIHSRINSDTYPLWCIA